ncbi:hypothetical protein HY414_01445 [Candidatus Kaiserbacteria bacterium]|nr:hypothetical protein [Candidatus Kaiserbacteria bacterium]
MANGRDDSVRCPPHADINVDWQFGGAAGWRRTELEGVSWRDEGPLDEWCASHLRAHFGLPPTQWPLELLRTTPPVVLREHAGAVQQAA